MAPVTGAVMPEIADVVMAAFGVVIEEEAED